MSQSIEVNLADILNKIDQRLDRMEQSINDLKVGQARLEEKVDGLGKRLENQEFISRGVLVALIVAILGGFAKLFGFAGKA
jgi:K+/H+ antiporter YhaU regulatory subunit KhtT